MRKVALITGASSGIGKDLAYIHAEHGGDLILVARREDRLTDIKKELEDKHSVDVSVIVKDLSRIEAAQEVYDKVKSASIDVDYLINNAGFGGSGKFNLCGSEPIQAASWWPASFLSCLCGRVLCNPTGIHSR
ncbi:MAG: SDR family NAD(P)-dependent oxidoreductase [Desulfobacteraceae bacterium]|nr:SDR family NAD(P)-dependent oxidoreductase [Desulfobacteraceae bacterium]